MYFDRFDICEAWYVWASENHGGMFTKEYAIFGRLNRIRFVPRPSLNGWDSLTENGQEIYNAMESRKIRNI